MNDRTLLRGLLLAVIALVFGGGALRYPLGSFAHAGPGLFPLMVSVALLLIGIATMASSRRARREPLDFHPKNIALLMGALCGFAIVSKLLDMTVGIVFLIFVASLAGPSFSWKRSAILSAGLIVIAFAFQRLFGLDLPLL